MPSTLKAWIDRIHIPGVLAGDVQPLAGRPVVTVVSRGATYDAGTPTEKLGPRLPRPAPHPRHGTRDEAYPVTVSATLADRLPELAPLADHAAAEVADAKTTLERLATTLA
ncbi:NAD(P)H-dependent oxidoreductase [Curtobacterium flaccumfaciens]|nr:NAD(P)H-dependent oxidoreductase [Curtobacterium flaccumfaciens]